MISNTSKILILRLGSYGDLILFTQILPILHDAFPNAKIDWIVFEKYHDFLKGHPQITNLYCYKTPHKDKLRKVINLFKLIKKICLENYDLLIDLHDYDNSSTAYFTLFLSTFIKAKEKIGFYTTQLLGVKNLFLNKIVKINTYKHMLENYKELLRKIEVSNINYSYNFFLCKNDIEQAEEIIRQTNIKLNKLTILICPISEQKHKCWTEEYWKHLINHLFSKYPEINLIFAGSLEQKSKIERIINLIDKSNIQKTYNLAGLTNIKQMIHIMQKTNLVITVDSCFTHIATILNHPVITLINSYGCNRWKPLVQNSETLINNRNKKEVEMINIKPETVCKTVDNILLKINKKVYATQ